MTDAPEFTTAEAQVVRYKPQDVAAPNHNDLRSFVHAWFAAFDHRGSAEFFLAHLDDGDMTFNFDGEPLARDHATFRTWYADALDQIPWDFHDILGISISGVHSTGWTADFDFRHVGEAGDPRRQFNRVLHANWSVEHDGDRFVIRRYELTLAQDVIPLET